MAGFETARVNFAVKFSVPEMDITVIQLDRGANALLRIQVVTRISNRSELHRWWVGGWDGYTPVNARWTNSKNPWEACEYSGPLQRGAAARAIFCGSCGNRRAADGQFCGGCGAAFADAAGGGLADVRREMEGAVAHPATASKNLLRVIKAYSLKGLGPADRRLLSDKLAEILANAVPGPFIDGVSGTAPTGVLTLAAAQIVGGKARRLEPLGADLEVAELLLTRAPLEFGYWGPFKSLLKYMDPAVLPVAFGTALGRLARVGLSKPSSSPGPSAHCEDLSSLRDLFEIPSDGTVAYMERRMRRRLSALAESDPRTYAVVAAAMLAAWDARIGSGSFLPAYVMLGAKGYLTCDSRRVQLPVAQSVRRVAHPEVWDAHADVAGELLGSLRTSVEAFTFASQVVRGTAFEAPTLTEIAVPLALASADPLVVERGQAALATAPGCWAALSGDVWASFLLSADRQHVAATTDALLGRQRLVSVADAAYLLLSRGVTSLHDERAASIARLYLAYSAPGETGYRPRPTSLQADARAVVALATVHEFDRTPQAWRAVLSGVPRAALAQVFVEISEDERVTTSTRALLADLIALAGSDFELQAAAIECLGATTAAAIDLGWRLVSLCQDRTSTLNRVWDWVRGSDLLNKQRLTLVIGLLALADSEQVDVLLSGFLSQPDRRFNARQQATIFGGSPDAARVLWRALALANPVAMEALVLGDPKLLETVGNQVRRGDLLTLTHSQVRVILAYVEAHPDRIRIEPEFGARLACTPIPEVQRAAIDQLVRAGVLADYWLVLAESALPLPLAAAGDHLRSVVDREVATDGVLAAIDSQVKPVRDMGLALLDARRDVLDDHAIWTAMMESDDPVVQARVADEALTREWGDTDGLDGFDRRILVTRRSNRRAKEQVKERLAAAPAADLGQLALPQRLDALLDMAAGTNARDREWALRRLAVLKLSGVRIDEVRVSTTSGGEA